MTRSWTRDMNGERYLGDALKLVLHDLDREHKDCKIDEIVAGGRDRPFKLLWDAQREGYAVCAACFPQS